MAGYLFVVSMDVEPGSEALFNEVYDEEHVPYLLKVPGVRKVTRGEATPFEVTIGGERKANPAASPAFTAIYEIDGPEVLASDAWAEAVEKGRWPDMVRPKTLNRRHALYKVTSTQGG